MNESLKVPIATMGDKAIKLVKAASAFLPGPKGKLVNQLIGLITPPLQRRQQEFFEEVAARLAALEATGILQVGDLAANEGFLSILVQAARVASHNHRKEKLRLLHDAVVSTAISSPQEAVMQQIYVRYLDELTPEHVHLLAFLYKRRQQVEVRDAKSYEALYRAAAAETELNCPQSQFALWCEDLKSRWLIRVSREMDEFPGVYLTHPYCFIVAAGNDVAIVGRNQRFAYIAEMSLKFLYYF